MEKVLIITYYWPPAGGPGVQRWLKFVKYFPAYGYEPIVLTVNPDKAEYPIRDNSLGKDVRPGQLIFRTDCAGLYDYYKKFTTAKAAPYSGFANEGNPNLKQKIARFIRGNFFLPDARKGWNKFAYRQAAEIIREYGVNKVITTGPPMSTHLIGQKLKRRLGVYWIADFRDPWTDIFYYDKMYPTPIAKSIDRGYERGVLLTADKVVAVSPYLREILSRKSDRIPAAKIAVIENGYDAEDFNFTFTSPSTREFIITYTGTLASDYTLDAFINSLKPFVGSGIMKLRFVGKVVPEVMKKLSEELGDMVEFIPFVPHEEVVRHMQAASLLLLVIPNTPDNKGNLTGKLFEYLGSRTPILCVGPTDGNAASIISSCKAGKTFDYNDEKGMTDYLRKRLQDWREGKETASTGIERYSRKELAGLYVRLFQNR